MLKCHSHSPFVNCLVTGVHNNYFFHVIPGFEVFCEQKICFLNSSQSVSSLYSCQLFQFLNRELKILSHWTNRFNLSAPWIIEHEGSSFLSCELSLLQFPTLVRTQHRLRQKHWPNICLDRYPKYFVYEIFSFSENFIVL